MIDTDVTYFTEIEEHFQRARGTGLFLLSPRDWALAKAWYDAGIPLQAVLRGIDRAFENRRRSSMRAQVEKVNSLAYCAQTIAAEAQALARATPFAHHESRAPFTIEDICGFIARNVGALHRAGCEDIARSLEALNLEELYPALEELELRLAAIEENMVATLRANASDSVLIEAKRSLEHDLKPYGGKMSPDQLARLEKHFLDRRLLESAGLPRLSLFYLMK